MDRLLRQVSACQAAAGKASREEAGQRGARYRAVSFGAVRQAAVRQAWRVMASQGTERFDRVRIGKAGRVGYEVSRRGKARQGADWYGRQGRFRRG